MNSIRITSLYGSQPSSVVFVCKTAAFWPELQVSIGPRSHLSFCACKTTGFAPLWQVYMGSSPHLCFFPSKTVPLGQDLQVCMGPRLHLWFSAQITACLAQEYNAYTGSSPHLWFCACKTETLAYELLVSIGPNPHLWFLYAKQPLVDQHTSLYGYQTSPVILWMQNCDFMTRITSFCGSKTPHVVFACKTATSGPE